MTNQTSVIAIVQQLEHIQRRPRMYIGEIDADSMVHFLDGFDVVCGIFGIKMPRHPDTIYEQVVVERGWTFLAARPVEEMRQRGMDDEAIVHELLTIEIEAWKRSYNIP